jgi:hypothetical protein
VDNFRYFLLMYVYFVKTKEILCLEVTDKKVHDDAKVMDNLLENILKNNNNINIKSVLSDGWSV